jgi:hypothetical protein
MDISVQKNENFYARDRFKKGVVFLIVIFLERERYMLFKEGNFTDF